MNPVTFARRARKLSCLPQSPASALHACGFMNAQQDLFEKLGRELFQTETSAMEHASREAGRLLGTPLADILLRMATHARESLVVLPPSFQDRERLRVGQMPGKIFSLIRRVVIDRLVDRERSYRGTLLGFHHGVDLVRLMLPLASTRGEFEFEAWCVQWLEVREELLEQATLQLEWFATHPRQAIEPGTRPLSLLSS